jgi:hypothetical protein
MGLILTCDLHARLPHLLSPEHQQSGGMVFSHLADDCYPLRTVGLEGLPAVMNSVPPVQNSNTSNAALCYLSVATCNLTTFFPLPQVCLSLVILCLSFSPSLSQDRNRNLLKTLQVVPSASFHLLSFSFIFNVPPSTNHTGPGRPDQCEPFSSISWLFMIKAL